MAVVDFTRWFLALFFVGVATFYSIRILLLKREMGLSPVFVGKFGSLHFATHLAFRIFRVTILIVCVGRLLWFELDRYLLTFDVLWHPIILMIGNGLLLAGFSTVVATHYYMGKDWRSGTRLDADTNLIITGPFAISQNPMMVGVIIAQIGFFFALPSAFTLLCLAVGAWAVVAQADIERRLLRRRFGAAYDSYAANTPRWLIFK